MAKESVTHRIAMRMDFRHDDEMGCVLEVDTDEKGRFIVHFPEAQVWKLLTELVQVEGILRGARAMRRRKGTSGEDSSPRRAVA